LDRLTALVLLRWKLDLRAAFGARGRILGLLLALGFSLLFAFFGAFFVYFGASALARTWPQLLAPLASVAATAVGLFWALAPLVTGAAITETHDVRRLTHFPVRPQVLVLASMLANLTQPMVLAELPIVAALALALAGHAALLPFTLLGVLLSFGCVLAGAQLTGLALHSLSRNRRLWDLVLFVGLGLSLVLSLIPFLLLASGGRALRFVMNVVVAGDLFAWSPFGFGLRAAVHAGRGELLPFTLNMLAGTLSLAALLASSAWLTQRVASGDLAVGYARRREARPSRMWLGGRLGALIEKDLRLSWREPALKAMLLFGLLGPMLFLYFVGRMRTVGAPETTVLLLATFIGLSGFGANAFGLERRGIALLFAFPIDRAHILVAKNLVALLFRLPGLTMLAIAALWMASPACLPAAATLALGTILIGAGLDNFMSIWFPIAFPAPGGNPYGSASGGRRLGASLVSLLMMGVVVLVSSPFTFLAWFPLLYGEPWMWSVTLPIAFIGALCVYAMLIAVAGRLLARREPELLERMLWEY
jgi:hypothetical protein